METAPEIIGQELAILAHEIREPLAAILFSVEYASEVGYDEFVCRRVCDTIERQVRYMARIIDDVLEVSQAKHGKLCLRKSLMDMGSVIEAALDTNGPLLARRKLHLTISLPEEPILLVADPLRVQQVINNLLTNACKYTEPEGSIFLTVEAGGNDVSIEVRDTGIGIPPDVLPRVFDLFHQGIERSQAGPSGLGIGLALVKSLVELHGGSVTAQSAGGGCGASFTVRLPGAITIGSASPFSVEPPLFPDSSIGPQPRPWVRRRQPQDIPDNIHPRSVNPSNR